MKHPLIHVTILMTVILLPHLIFAQREPNPTIYPYGGERDYSRQDPRYKSIQMLNFRNHADFRDTIFSKYANFAGARFYNSVDFSWTRFDSSADFYKAHFFSKTNCIGTRFIKNADFVECQFDSSIDFTDAKFYNTADFSKTNFNNVVNFNFVLFNKGFNLSYAKIKGKPEFGGTIIKGKLNLQGTQFLEGVDFRRVNFDSLKNIYIDDRTVFPDGKLWINWSDIKDRILLKLSEKDSIMFFEPPDFSEHNFKIKDVNSIRYNEYQKLEIFYYRLRDNYKAQQDNMSADEVMFELAKQHARIYGNWVEDLYGFLFGWGYKPFTFLYVLLMIFISFIVLWYNKKYLELVIKMVDDNIGQKNIIFKKKRIQKTKKIGLLESNELNCFSTLWHVIYFSAWVLLSIRFNKRWFQKDYQINKQRETCFLIWISIEWFLGICWYIFFISLIKVSWFAYIKDFFLKY